MKIQYVEGDNTLVHKYPGQFDIQPCYVELDIKNETLTADWNAEVGNAIPFSVYYGFEQRFPIPCLKTRIVNDLLDEIAPLAEIVIAGYESVWNGNNNIASFNDEAQGALEEIEQLCESYYGDTDNQVQIYDISDWIDPIMYPHFKEGYCNLDGIGTITAKTTDEELQDMTEEIEASTAAEDVVLLDDVYDYLEHLRDECYDKED